MTTWNMSLSIESDEPTIVSSQPGSSVSLFFSSHETSAALVSFSIVLAWWRRAEVGVRGGMAMATQG